MDLIAMDFILPHKKAGLSGGGCEKSLSPAFLALQTGKQNPDERSIFAKPKEVIK
jgi:hypothetical protein